MTCEKYEWEKKIKKKRKKHVSQTLLRHLRVRALQDEAADSSDCPHPLGTAESSVHSAGVGVSHSAEEKAVLLQREHE